MNIGISLILIPFVAALLGILKVAWYEFKGRRYIRVNYPDEWLDNFMAVRGGYGGSVFYIIKLKVDDPKFNKLKISSHRSLIQFVISFFLAITVMVILSLLHEHGIDILSHSNPPCPRITQHPLQARSRA